MRNKQQFWYNKYIDSNSEHYPYLIELLKRRGELSANERVRVIVRIRDDFTCADCNLRRSPSIAKKEGKRLHDVHHINGLCGIKNRTKCDSLKELGGLITLCHKCHYNRSDVSNQLKNNRVAPPAMKERNSKILEMNRNGLSGQVISKKFGISHQRVSQILLAQGV